MSIAVPETTRILAIRHGETAWNVAARLQGHLDIALNDTGRAQARQVASALYQQPVTAIYSSDLVRALETARTIAAALGCPLHSEADLRERAFGFFEGKTHAELEAWHPQEARLWREREPDFAPVGGESLRQFFARIVAVTARLAARHSGELIVLVAHGGVMDVLYRHATGQSLQASRSWALGNASINRLLWSPQGLTLLCWDDTAHLERAGREEDST